MAETALADTLLSAVSSNEYARIIQNIVENLSNSTPGDENGYALARLLLQIRDKMNLQIDHDQARNTEILLPILAFICRTIHTFEQDIIRLRSAVSFCALCPEVLEILVTACEVILTSFISVQTGDEDISALKHKSTPAAVLSAQMLDEAVRYITVGDCLSFMKVLLRQTPVYHQKISRQWMIILSNIVKNASQAESNRSKDVILAFLSCPTVKGDQSQPSALQDELEPVKAMFWHRILDLADISTTHQAAYLVTTGLTIWLRILSAAQASWLPSDAFDNNDYWQRILSILAFGSFEQRKISLAILKRSIRLCTRDLDLPLLVFRESEAETYRSQYARFTTLFETIVLARYLNQVQDCLPDLDAISGSTSLVQSSWIMAMIHASLSNNMQGSVRKTIGFWTLDHASTLVSQSRETGAAFLEHAFLPWATMGAQFFFPVRKSLTGETVCPFGERLSEFLAEAIHSARDDLIKSLILRATLNYLASKGGRIYSFARAFVLDGLVLGLRRAASTLLEEEEVHSLGRIVQEQGFQEVVRDLMVLQCAELYELAAPTHLRDTQYISALLRVRNPVHSRAQSDLEIKLATEEVHFPQTSIDSPDSAEGVYPMVWDETLLEKYPARQMTQWLKHSKQRCLAGTGLKVSCDFLYRALQTGADVELAPADINYVLNAIWDEVQLREYPRPITTMMPRIIFHSRYASLISRSLDLATTLDYIANLLWNMSRTRIYLFPPIAFALRRVFLGPPSDYFPFTQLILNYANGPPSVGVDFQLERTMSSKLEAYVSGRNYEYYYGKTEAYGHAIFFDTLNRLPEGEPWDTYCRGILDRLIEPWLQQKHPIPVFAHWKTTTQLQFILMFVERLTPKLSRSDVGVYLSSLLKILATEPLPRFRFLIEWTVSRIYVHVPEKQYEVLEALSRVDIANPKYAASLIKLALMVTCLPGTGEGFGSQVMAELVSLSASQKIVIRHEAHWTVPLLWDHAEKQNWTLLTSNIAFARLNRHIRSLATFEVPPPARALEHFHPIDDHNLTNLVQGKYLQIEPSEIGELSQGDLIAVREEDDTVRGRSTEALVPLGLIETKKVMEEQANVAPPRVPTPIRKKVLATPLQTKSSTWHDNIPYHDFQVTGDTNAERLSNGIIVVASLIDNPHNLGGISRVSEIFSVESLQVRNTNVIKNKDFTSVSVSSHLWLPIEELGLDAIPAFLIQCKSNGYQVVGVEQTDSSRALGTEDCKLPWKMVLVLGSEREGIPAELLSEMDFCIEVKQTGVTRSMNVQTALSVGLFEYQRQHQ